MLVLQQRSAKQAWGMRAAWLLLGLAALGATAGALVVSAGWRQRANQASISAFISGRYS